MWMGLVYQAFEKCRLPGLKASAWNMAKFESYLLGEGMLNHGQYELLMNDSIDTDNTRQNTTHETPRLNIVAPLLHKM